MTFAEWWKSIEGWKTEGGSGESKARAAWEAASELRPRDALIGELDRSRDRVAALESQIASDELKTVKALADLEAENAKLRADCAVMVMALERAKGFVDSWGKKLGDWDQVDQNTINAINAAITKRSVQ